MKRSRPNGFVLILVVALIGLAGAGLALLTHGSNSMRFDAERMYSQAARRSLTTSGLAWARHQIKLTGGKPPAGERALATDELEIPGAQLKVSIRAKGAGGFEVRIATSHRRGGRTFRSRATYDLPAQP